MASDADLCNLALGHVGDDTIVTSINPVDSSAAAGHCARFYAIARRMLLEMEQWSFALKRIQLAQVDNDSNGWAFKYELPSTIVKPVKIIDAGTYVGGYPGLYSQAGDIAFSIFNEQGSALFERQGAFLRCNIDQAVLLYVDDITDPTLFSPTFQAAFSYMLGSFIAGPIVKGKEGINLAQGLRSVAAQMAKAAAVLDANASAQNSTSEFTPSSISARGYGHGDYNTVRY